MKWGIIIYSTSWSQLSTHWEGPGQDSTHGRQDPATIGVMTEQHLIIPFMKPGPGDSGTRAVYDLSGTQDAVTPSKESRSCSCLLNAVYNAT